MPDYNDYIYPLSNNTTALVVMAADAEYGAKLKALSINPLITGVGPVQAAMTLTYALSELSHARPPRRPDVIINIGSAGSATLEQGRVYRVSSSNYRDMDASAFSFPKGQTPFSTYPAVVSAPAFMTDFPAVSCSTGGDVVKDHATTGTDMAEMEYYALCVVAMKFGIPLVGFKGISDGKKPLTGQLMDWAALLPLIDENLAGAISLIKSGLAQGGLKREELCAMPDCWKPEHSVFRRQPGIEVRR